MDIVQKHPQKGLQYSLNLTGAMEGQLIQRIQAHYHKYVANCRKMHICRNWFDHMDEFQISGISDTLIPGTNYDNQIWRICLCCVAQVFHLSQEAIDKIAT